jgi:hypothetical protein
LVNTEEEAGGFPEPFWELQKREAVLVLDTVA